MIVLTSSAMDLVNFLTHIFFIKLLSLGEGRWCTNTTCVASHSPCLASPSPWLSSPAHLHCPTNWPAPCRPQLHLLTKCQPPPLMLLDLVLPNPITVHRPTSSSKCCGPTFAPQRSLNLDALLLHASSWLVVLLIQHHSPNFMAIPPPPIQPPS